MIQLGIPNCLTISRLTEFGLFLTDDEQQEVLLPNRYVPTKYEIGDKIDVFIFHDSENRLTATTQTPYGKVGDFVSLKVVAKENAGVFLDWGLSKDLFLPFAEQTRNLRAGDKVVVYIYIDSSDRLAASMRLDRHLPEQIPAFSENQEVQVLITGKTDLGYKALIESSAWGVLYFNEVFQDLKMGEQVTAFIKKVRADNKIDLSLQRLGHQAADDIAPYILKKLEANGGFLEINDKTSAEFIYEMFGVSKKKYKMALGSLYKQRIIRIDNDGIRMVNNGN